MNMKQAHYLLGITWYPTRIKICRIAISGRTHKVIGLDAHNLDPTRSDSFTTVLTEYIATHTKPGDHIMAAVSIPESSVFLKEIDLPTIKTNQIETAVFWEIPSITPIASKDALYHWQLLSQTETTSQIAVMVMKNDLAQSIFNSVKEAGAVPVAIIPFSTALSHLATNSLDKPSLVMTVDEDEVNFVVLKQGYPVFSTSTNTHLKRLEVGNRTLDQQSSDVLAQHAKSAIDYGKTRNIGAIDQILITGDVTKYYGLANTIYHTTKIPTFILKHKAILLDEDPNLSQAAVKRFSVALGSAMSIIAGPGDLNFLPKEEAQKRQSDQNQASKRSWFYRVSLANLFISLLILSLLALLTFNTENAKREHQTLVRFIQNHPGQTILQHIESANNIAAAAQEVMLAQVDEGVRLTALSDMMPGSLSLTKIELLHDTSHQWRLEGVGDRSDILAFYDNLKATGNPAFLTMPYSNLNQEKQAAFIVEVIWP
jgi:Tfp pilus assembly PilM family ATPase